MNPRVMFTGVVLCALALLSTAAQAQSSSAGAPVLYRLEGGASYQSGCFPPCMCPILLNQSLAGTFTLTREGTDGPWAVYRVDNINWHVPLGDGVRVTGSGEYRIGSPGPVAVVQNRLTLDLAVGDLAVAHYDSGQVIATGAFPRIDITISMNAMFCHDTVFDFAASPVRSSELRRYQLLQGSEFLEGCYDPCDCVLRSRPVAGVFDVVRLPATSNTAPATYALVNIRWFIAGLSPVPAANATMATPVGGFGIYTCEPVSATRRLRLDLAVGQNTKERYDSGNVITNVPQCGDLIHIAAATDGFVCFNRVFDIEALPVNATPAQSLVPALESSPALAR